MLDRRAFLSLSTALIPLINDTELGVRSAKAQAFPSKAVLNPHHTQFIVDVQASLRNDIALGRLGADGCVSVRCPICHFPMTISATAVC